MKDYFWRSKARNIIGWIVELVAVVLLAFVCTYAFGQRVIAVDTSMEPTLAVGDKALLNTAVKAFGSLERGDVVAYRTSNDVNASIQIRRIIGLPGETVQIRSGQIFIDGELYLEQRDFPPISNPGLAESEITLGGTEYFVLGDSRNNSEDSRHVDVGNVDKEQILGRLWLKTDPMTRIR
ncbi:MAG: signal peptidase I [Lachnospiraceae bacterium]|nr:signal peptidase I [Lachnospiraceae bacterium]